MTAVSRKARAPRAAGIKRLWDIQSVRCYIQTGFVAFIGVLVFNRFTTADESVATSPEAYCPLGGFETLFKYATADGQFVPHAHLSNLVLFAAVVVTAVAARSYFCGWICPLGAIQQAITASRRWLQRQSGTLQSAAHRLENAARPLAFLDRRLRWGKYLVLAWIIWGSIALGTMVFRDYDPWAAIINIASPEKSWGLVVLGLTLLAAVFGNRIWCKYACPLGLIVGLVSKLSPTRVQREGSACTGCQRCSKVCPMDIPVHEQSQVGSVECNMCLHCVSACPIEGALEVRAGLPGLGGKRSDTRTGNDGQEQR